MSINIAELDWDKMDDLIPAVIQDHQSAQVLMLGYVSRAALEHTLKTNEVTFYSRSKKRLWTKGETSGNTLQLKDCLIDCDQDSVLILAEPHGPTCHLGTSSCFGDTSLPPLAILAQLTHLIATREDANSDESYTAQLLQGDVKRIAQKVGEEGIEVSLAAATQDLDECKSECADLIYHLLVLLQHTKIPFNDVLDILKSRMNK